MFKRFATFLALLPALAFGQSVPNGVITQGLEWTVAQWTSAWQSKADTASPVFTGSPTIGGVAIPTVASPAFTGIPTIAGVPIPTYPQTADEISASVTPTNLTYPAGNVLRYGADPLGSVDSTAAVTRASAALNAIHGGTIYFPSGIYKVTAVTISRAANVYGDGIGATQIYANDAASNVFTITGSSVDFHDFAIAASVTRTGGRYFYATNTSSIVSWRNLYLLGWYYGIDMEGTNYSVRDIIEVNGVPTNGTAIAVGLDATVGTLSDISIINAKVDNPGGSKPFACVDVAASGDIKLIDDELQHCGTALAVQPTGTKVVASLLAVNSFFDNSGTNGVLMQPQAAGAAIVRVRFNGCWFSSSGTNGALLDTSSFGGSIDGVTFIDPEALLNGSQGINLAGTGTVRVKIIGGKIGGNASAGVLANAGVGQFQIYAATIGPIGAVGGNNIGIQVLAGASNNYIINGNDLTGNTASALNDAGAGLIKAVNNNLGVSAVSGTTGSIGGGALGAGACASGTVAITGLTTAMAVTATPVTYPGDGNTWMAYTSAAGTATIKVCAIIAGTPTASAYNVRIIQ